MIQTHTGGLEKPFVGLRPFETSESILFFGRDEQAAAILEKLHKTHFVAIVGNSGCGKSSLIKAGVIPNLLAGFMVAQRDRWVFATMRPGSSPMYNLAYALLKAISDKQKEPGSGEVQAFVDEIKSHGTDAVISRLSPLFQRKDTNLLLFLDQFEEIFRFSVQSGDRRMQKEAVAFVSLILHLSREENLDLYTILAMRSDFIGECDFFYGLPEALNKSQYLVPRLTREQLRRTIAGPVRLFNQEISSALVNRILNEDMDKTDPLPVIQHTLMRTWDIWSAEKTGGLDIQHYKQAGGVQNALSLHADGAMQGMNKEEEELTKRIFQCLADTDQGGRKIRRPARLKEMCGITGAKKEQIEEILNKFRSGGRSFIIMTDDPDRKDRVIDISHESFIRLWKRMDEWIKEEAEDKKQFLKLIEAKKDFDNNKAGYLTGIQLGVMLAWHEKKNPSEEWAIRYLEKVEKRKAKEITDQVRDFLLTSKRKREEEVRKRKRRTILVISALSVLTIAAIVFAIFAFIMANKAEIARTEAVAEKNRAIVAQKNEKAAKKVQKSTL